VKRPTLGKGVSIRDTSMMSVMGRVARVALGSPKWSDVCTPERESHGVAEDVSVQNTDAPSKRVPRPLVVESPKEPPVPARALAWGRRCC
jgi:hypothetical protein